ncbi:MAG: dihydropteroate synthase [Pyrinomonadaceae bacterium MAG19_C2-C3]|nr:dihydropteroate synthase [Pyrinomonadaceae bacterium MAG19_C2-C3]
MREWKIKGCSLKCEGRTLVMGILNVTPDSFSDGGVRDVSVRDCIMRAGKMIDEGADIIDIGGESTRPGAATVSVEEEARRVLPVIKELISKHAHPISVDTTKPEIARRALSVGAGIINDISGLRFAPEIADHVAAHEAGLVLMHSLGTPQTLHTVTPVEDILKHVGDDWRRGIAEALRRGVHREAIALDPGFGFGKTFEQNIELLRRLDELVAAFADFPVLVGTSRKRFIGKLLNDAPIGARLHGTMATVSAAVFAGAKVVRVHDVRAAVETVRVCDAILTV